MKKILFCITMFGFYTTQAIDNLTYPYTLPPLDYGYSALAPSIDARTMKIHHTKHHQKYIDNLNKALASHPELHDKTISELLQQLKKHPKPLRAALKNNGGGHYNHSLFWKMMAPPHKKQINAPTGTLLSALNNAFGSFEKFKKQFNMAAQKVFGSGWAWLCLNDNNKLVVVSSYNQDSPLMDGFRPVLGLDVWEHAYYLKYQNKRPEYIDAWWNVVNWPYVQERYEQLLAQ